MIPVAAQSALREAAQDEVNRFQERTARKLADLRCPVHGQAPRLRFHGASLRDVTIQMSACCEQLIGLANQKIIERST